MRYFNKKSGSKRWVWYVMLRDGGLQGSEGLFQSYKDPLAVKEHSHDFSSLSFLKWCCYNSKKLLWATCALASPH